jgi:hypothetical protein
MTKISKPSMYILATRCHNPEDCSRYIHRRLITSLAVLPLRRCDCDSTKKKVDYTKFMASRHRIVVVLVGEVLLRTEGSTSRRL